MSYIPQSTVCISCQSDSVSDNYELFIAIKNRRNEEYKRKTGYICTDSTFTDSISMKDVLDAISVKNICCRQMILGHNYFTQDSLVSKKN